MWIAARNPWRCCTSDTRRSWSKPQDLPEAPGQAGAAQAGEEAQAVGAGAGELLDRVLGVGHQAHHVAALDDGATGVLVDADAPVARWVEALDSLRDDGLRAAIVASCRVPNAVRSPLYVTRQILPLTLSVM